MSTDELKEARAQVITSALEAKALLFGSFTLKSGRQSPYFLNSGLFCTGKTLANLASAYASLITSTFPDFDVLYGPAYKGIPLGAVTAVALQTKYGRDVGFAYNRKEAKAHGEGGMHVGADVKGKKVLLLDDVFTAGTAIREATKGIRDAGGEVVGVILCLDREEVGKEGEAESAKSILERELGAQVSAVLRMQDLVAWLESVGRTEDLAAMKAYREKYGVKET